MLFQGFFEKTLFHFKPSESIFIRILFSCYILGTNNILGGQESVGGSVSNSPISTNTGFPGPLTYSTRFVIPLSIRLLRISARDLPHEASVDEKSSKTRQKKGSPPTP